ncbi:MAG: hypothetical protein K2N43_03475 [Lachnospiraceae bacterium]|nr:hypothetical protein [Lachnospiraceae bacterium]
MKRKFTLAAVLVGALLLPLCSCIGGIEEKAQRYLSGQYSGEFTITDAERIANETGPIPVFVSSYHWKLTAKSAQFPGETFFVFYRKAEDKQWHWSDNYYSILFRDEAEKACKELVDEMFAASCIIESVWGISPWPNGTDDNSTIQEWMDAGGKINRLTIWFCGFLPDDDACAAFSNALTNELPNICSVHFMGLELDGYQTAAEQQENIVSIWDAHPDWRIGQIRYDCENRKIIQSARYSTD